LLSHPYFFLLIYQHYKEDLASVLIPAGLINDRVEKLAEMIAKDSINPIVAICVLKGAAVFHADLTRVLKRLKGPQGRNLPLSFEFIKVKSYENENSTGSVNISGLTEQELESFKGKDILIVEDIVDTGRTMTCLLERLKKYEPASVKVVSLLVKKTERSNNYVPDYVGVRYYH
jgi:hypoxanthine phosphoribosyltransferase